MLEKSRIYKMITKIVDDYASVYNYNYLLEKDDIVRKSYMISSKDIILRNLGNSAIMASECLSLGINILKEIGLNPTLKIIPDNNQDFYQDLYNYLDYLDIDYEELNEGEKGSFTILEDNKEIGRGKTMDSTYLEISIKDLIEILREMNVRITPVDVNIMAFDDESLLKAGILLQDLRLSGIIADLDVADSKMTINIKEELLNKGLLNVIDNVTKEGSNVPEDEIIDYLLGMI